MEVRREIIECGLDLPVQSRQLFLSDGRCNSWCSSCLNCAWAKYCRLLWGRNSRSPRAQTWIVAIGIGASLDGRGMSLVNAHDVLEV